MLDPFVLIKYGLLAILAIALIIFILSGYVKAAPNEAWIISGLKKKEENRKVLIGRAGVKIPFFERKDRLSLALIPIDLKTTTAVPTADYINVKVDANVNVQIGRDTQSILTASANFLNLKDEAIGMVAREVLEGNMREIVGQMTLTKMVSDRQEFAKLVTENAKPDLARMGLNIISFNVQSFIDNDKVIENLGVDNVVAISKKAAISRAESEKEIKVAQAKADMEANEARVQADTAIAEKNTELEIKKANLKAKSDKEQASADAAYKIEEQNQRREIETARIDADTQAAERTTELKRKEVMVKEEALNAEVKKTADAELYRRTKEAEAEKNERVAKAEADKTEQELQAEARKKVADADLYAKQQEASGITAIGQAQAEAIRAQGMAEAEAMEKKAEAYKKYGDAAITEMIINQLPGIAEAIAKPISSIDKITVIDSGGGESGVGQVGAYVPVVMKQVMEATRELTGFDLTEVWASKTKAALTDRNINYSGDPAVSVNHVDATNVVDATTENDGDSETKPEQV